MSKTRHAGTPPNAASFYLVLVAATFLLGSSFIAGKILLAAGFPAFLLVGWRFLVAALATLPLVFMEGAPRAALFPPRAGLRDAALTILIGLLQTAAVMGLLFLSMQSISASTAAILLFTNPIWVALLGRLFLGEPLAAARASGLVIGLAGTALAIGVGPSLSSGGGSLTGELVGLASSLCWAVSTLVNKRANLPLGPWALSFWQMLVGSLALLGLAYGLGQHWPPGATTAQWGWFLWLAIPASTGSFGLWFVALRQGGATRTSGFLFLAPLFTVMLSFFVLGAPLSWQQGAGGTLIGISLWLVNRNAPARSRKEEIAAAAAEGRP
jgi:drug/metabolite transporter (DMT)-like permease